MYARVAQLAEQLICNQQVVGSNPTAGSNFIWGISSVGRAVALQATGRWFDPSILHQIRVLSSAGRAAPLHGVGRKFDPCRTHHIPKWRSGSAEDC